MSPQSVSSNGRQAAGPLPKVWWHLQKALSGAAKCCPPLLLEVFAPQCNSFLTRASLVGCTSRTHRCARRIRRPRRRSQGERWKTPPRPRVLLRLLQHLTCHRIVEARWHFLAQLHGLPHIARQGIDPATAWAAATASWKRDPGVVRCVDACVVMCKLFFISYKNPS